MGLVSPLDLNSPHSVNPCGKVLEVFWGVVEGYTSPRRLVEVFGRSFSSGLLSGINQIHVQKASGGVPPPEALAHG